MIEFLTQNKRWLSAGALLALGSSFGQTFFIALFAGKIQAEFGLSHGEWGGLYAAGTLTSAIVMIWSGALTDKFRVKTLGPAMLLGLSLACIAMAMNPWVWMLPVVIFALRFFGQGMLTHVGAVAMSRWFVANRGKALSFASLGFSTGEALLPMIFVALMTVFAWQSLWLLSALLCLALIPILRWLLVLERSPQSISQTSQAAGMGGRQWTRGNAIKHSLFWWMMPALLGPSAFNTAFFFHQVHYTEITGITHLQLVGFLPIYTSTAILAMLFTGNLLDRIGTSRLLVVYLIPAALGFICFGVASNVSVIFLGMICLAITTGANGTLINAFWAEFYGTRHLGSVKSVGTAIMVLGSAIGPGVTGFFIDSGISLATQFIWVGAYFCIAAGMIAIGMYTTRTLRSVSA